MANDWKEAASEGWDTWKELLNCGADEKISNVYRLYRAPMWQMGFTKALESGKNLLAIGAEADKNVITHLQTQTIPANKWAVFTMRGSFSGK